ncbi:hypothetical protein R2601_03488 [Salipiger bermudensis HTCC2601]|uniref:Uncharacterized protein n=1 Tax=Salipiger bermudensis (strain DSM 26914 / JCM 13377 / KCTC 12554 / HTCC2601) TaxID=314265 RepID=Q0FWE8_SALBH|nr:hypothetical protein R2601_03488 [Salipiger bermudensis HTCC2601]
MRPMRRHQRCRPDRCAAQGRAYGRCRTPLSGTSARHPPPAPRRSRSWPRAR